METIAAHGNCLFRRFGVLLRDEGQYNVRIAHAYILYSGKIKKKKLYSTFPPSCCTYVVIHKYVPRNMYLETDSEAVMSK
jgi:hypothetical protein